MANVTFEGNLGPRINTGQYTDKKGIPRSYIQFNVAENYGAYDMNGNYNETFTKWWSCTIFGWKADSLRDQLQKGTRVVVVGHTKEPKQRTYQRKDGVEVENDVTIIVDNIGVLPPTQRTVKQAAAPTSQGTPAFSPNPPAQPEPDDSFDIEPPF